MLRKLSIALSLIGLIYLEGCMSPPTGVDLALDRQTSHGRYRVELRPLADPNAINTMQTWEVRLRSSAGEAISGARISVGGGMPQHRHGFPTQPRVTRELGNGRYLIEGMKFSMPGWWEVKLNIEAESGVDAVTFNTIISTSNPQPARAAS